MSKRIDVNPGQYRVAGREKMGENLGQQRPNKAVEQLTRAHEVFLRGRKFVFRQEPQPPRKFEMRL